MDIYEAERRVAPAMWRGWMKHCPACGRGGLLTRFLKVNHRCDACGTELHHQRADDAPPYFTIVVVGHIIVPLMLLVEQRFQPAEWVHAALWVPLTVVLALWLLPKIKGALVGLQWAMRMHGFGGHAD